MKTSTLLIGGVLIGAGAFAVYKIAQPAVDPSVQAGQQIGGAVGAFVGAIKNLALKVTSPIAHAVGQTGGAVQGALLTSAPPQGAIPSTSALYVGRAYAPWAQSYTVNRAPAQQQTRSVQLARMAGIGR